MTSVSTVLIVGAGRWGEKLIRVFQSLVGDDHVLVAERDRSRWPAGASPGWYEDYTTAMRFADAVVVATQPASHYTIAMDALAAGKHVLVEKPMALRPDLAVAMVAMAEARRLVLQTDDTWQYHPAVVNLLERHAGKSGVLFASWCNPKTSKAEDSILWVNGPHPVSLALCCAPRDFAERARVGGRLSNEEADILLLTGEFRAIIRLSWKESATTRLLVTAADSLDAATAPYGDKDPLTRMAEKFLERCAAAPAHAWQDQHGLEVVRVLWRVQQELSAV